MMGAYNRLTDVYGFLKPVLDIGLLGFALYKAYGIVVKTNGGQIVRALIVLVVAYAVAWILKLSTALWILNTLGPSLLVSFVVIFQPELRKVFLQLGQGNWFFRGRYIRHTNIDSVLIAAEELSGRKRGMLVVFSRHNDISHLTETGGFKLHADISSALLVTIFAHDTPMHDGAVIIQGGKILAASCHLPLSKQYNIKKTFGTRHRAALGMAEETDAVVLIVSEETGAISLAYDSKLYYDLNSEQLARTLKSKLETTSDTTENEDIANDA
jgi:diadenylate cyclase